LVPSLLDGWVSMLAQTNARAPASLRFVAVGGAKVPHALAHRARSLGIPAFEGYGLSECCSVVAVNTPKADRPGSVGKPLQGISLSIENGEIVVTGSNVMKGYLGSKSANGRWRTGDLGFMDEDGFLHVQGRSDNVLITSHGRNVAPEWIEAMMEDDPRIKRSIVFGQGQASLGALIVPSVTGEAWFTDAESSEVSSLMNELCRMAPEYARPDAFVLTNDAFLHRQGFMTQEGKIRRREINDHFATMVPQERKIYAVL